MSIKQMVMPAGPKFIEYRADQEPWAQYTLENGVVIRIRIMLVKVIDSDQFNPDGSPRYLTQFQQVMDVTWPEDMKREIEARQRKAGGGS